MKFNFLRRLQAVLQAEQTYRLCKATSLPIFAICLLFVSCANSEITDSQRAKAVKVSNKTNVEPTNDATKPLEIFLDGNIETNSKHTYFDAFSTHEDKDFIYGLYHLNKSYEKNKGVAKKKIVKNQGAQNSLIFTLKRGDKITYDTLQNNVHPEALKKELDMGNLIPVSGKLPDGVWSSLENNPKGKTTVTLYLKEKSAKALIAITTIEGKLIKTLVDSNLEKGTHDFQWNPDASIKGRFYLNFEIDGQKMTQHVDVE